MKSGSSFIAFLPIFIAIYVSIGQQSGIKSIIRKRKNRKAGMVMTNDLIKKYIGRDCAISAGSFGTNVYGKIISVNENWIEVETKKGVEIINAEFVQSIKVR